MNNSQPPLKALLVDSWYDAYLGVIILVRIFNGEITKGMKIKMMMTGGEYVVEKVGVFTPKITDKTKLESGEIGFITAGIKQASDCNVGETITSLHNQTETALDGLKEVVPMVFCGLYPIDGGDFEKLRESLGKLHLNDASFTYEGESSSALGFGFRCGFLGLLHLEIIQERLIREFDLELITTAPSVVYKITKNNGEELELHNPADMPDPVHIAKMEEPWITATILVPDEYLGNVLTLCTEKRGVQIDLTYAGKRVMLQYKLPLNEIVFDFYDKLKSCSKGYASFDYQLGEHTESDLVKLSVLVNNETVDALSMIVHRSKATGRGRSLCKKLKELIPRQLFKIPIQSAVDGKVIARETLSAMRKDVIAKCYGGDITRKKKLLEKQKKGKKKMRDMGSVNIPQSAFLAALKMGDD